MHNNSYLELENLLIYIEALYKALKRIDIKTHEIFILLNLISNVFIPLGKLNLSFEILTIASNISQNINNISDENLSKFHSVFGDLYKRKGDRKNSLKHSELACLLAGKNKGFTLRTLGMIYSNLGHAYNTFGKIDKSIESFKKAQKYITSEDSNHDSSYIYKGIAEAYKISGDNESALKNFKEALALRKKYFKTDNPLIAHSYNDLAFIYVVMGQRKKALPLYIKAMKGYEKILGERHIDTACVYNNLGDLYRSIKQYNKAYPLIKKAMNIRELEQETNLIDVANSYNTMGVYYIYVNKYDQARKYLTKSLNILNSTFGQYHEHTIQIKNTLEYLDSLVDRKNNRTTNHIKIGRNSPCSCGSEKKYKKCCGQS